MRAFRKAALATMVAALALATPVGIAAAIPDVAAAAGAAGATTTASKTSGLAAAGETIKVSGTGFSGDGAGIYVGLVQDNKYSATDADAWMTQNWVKSASIVGGKWELDVDVKAVAGASDCTKNACSIYTVAAHGSSDRSQDTKVPVSFSSTPSTSTPSTSTPTSTKPTSTTTKPPASSTTTPPMITSDPDPDPSTSTPPPSSSGARTNLSKASGLNPAGETITVSGSGFSGGGAGIYVGLAQNDRFSHSDESAWMSTVFVKSSEISAGGWSASVEVVAAKGGFDCLANKCSIFTVAAHGSSDRSQDTRADVSFTGTAAPGGSDASGGSGTSGGGSGAGVSGGGGAAAGGGFTGSNSNLSVTLSKSTGLNPGGESVTISGAGFSGAAPGLYVGLVQDDKFSSTNADVWMTTTFLKPDQISGGTWSMTAELPSTAGGSDCMKNTCSIYTVAAHGSSDRSQDSRTPVGFLGGVAPATDTSVPGGGAAAANGGKTLVGAGNSVKVELSKKEGLNADGETIKVTGEGFSGEGAGIYVGLIQDDKFSVTDAAAWITTKYVKSAEMKDGKWTADVEVKAVAGGSDCTKNECSIYTVAAHGSSDRTQDSQTPVKFGPGTGAGAAAAAAGSDADVRNMASSAGTGPGWLGTLLIGGLAGGLVGGGVVAGTFLARRREV